MYKYGFNGKEKDNEINVNGGVLFLGLAQWFFCLYQYQVAMSDP